MSLKLKLWIVLGIPAVFIAAIVIWMRQTSGMIARELDDARSYHLSVVRHVSQMKVNVVEVWQYFTDISATRARDGLDDGYAQAAKCRESFLKAMAVVRGLEQRGQNDERVVMLDKTKEAFEVYYRSGRIMAEAYVQDGTDAGNKYMKHFDETAEGLSKLMDPLIEESTKGLEDALERVDRQTYFQRDAIMYAGLFAVIGGLVVASIARRSIRKPMQRIIANLSTESSSLSLASGQVSQSSLTVSERASAQASALEETSASLEELTAMIRQNSEGALKVDALARRAKETAEIGIGQVQEMNTAMGAIRGSSGEIAAIVKTINEIAFQTNILALNAAVEAARAGEAGAGFAVVAEEVRNLAKRSAEAANETTAKIAKAIDISQHGVNYSEQVAQAFKAIEEEARELAMLSSEVSRACVEQTQGIHQINQAVSEMDSTTQANAADAEHSSELATSLHGQAGALNETIGDLVQLIDGRGAMEKWKSENQVT